MFMSQTAYSDGSLSRNDSSSWEATGPFYLLLCALDLRVASALWRSSRPPAAATAAPTEHGEFAGEEVLRARA